MPTLSLQMILEIVAALSLVSAVIAQWITQKLKIQAIESIQREHQDQIGLLQDLYLEMKEAEAVSSEVRRNMMATIEETKYDTKMLLSTVSSLDTHLKILTKTSLQ